MTREEAVREFHQLRNDDPDFANMYGHNEIDEWLKDNNINLNKKMSFYETKK